MISKIKKYIHDKLFPKDNFIVMFNNVDMSHTDHMLKVTTPFTNSKDIEYKMEISINHGVVILQIPRYCINFEDLIIFITHHFDNMKITITSDLLIVVEEDIECMTNNYFNRLFKMFCNRPKTDIKEGNYLLTKLISKYMGGDQTF